MSSPVASTISRLYPQKISSNSTFTPSFDSPNHILIRNGASAPPDNVKAIIKALVEAAEKAAMSLACSSILVGQGSESDDYGDAGLWLGKGEYGEGHENEVLKALDLQSWIQEEQIVPVELQPPESLPSTLPARLDLKSHAVGAAMEEFTKLSSSFQQQYCFRVRKAGPMSGGDVAFFLLGQLDDHGWGGLVGVGVWADE